jgi:hypothetical protein
MTFGQMPDYSVRWWEKLTGPLVGVAGLVLLCAGVLLISVYLSLLDLWQRLTTKK